MKTSIMDTEFARERLLDDPTNHRRHQVSGPSGVKYATEASTGACHQTLPRRNATDDKKNKASLRTKHRIGTWNVRGLCQSGKLSIVEREMELLNITILGISETHMRGNGHFKTPTGATFYFSGSDHSSVGGVGLLIPSRFNKHVLGYNPVSDRVITIRLNTKPCVLNIVQIYAPTASSSEDDIDTFYRTVETTLGTISSREIVMILGDWNAKVGCTSSDNHIRNTVGRYGIGTRNERGQRLIEFCIDRKLTITNTCFQHHRRRLYTWRSPGDKYRNQIDFIMIQSRWKSSVTNVKTFPGAECGSDHNLLVADFTLRLKAPKTHCQLKPKQLDTLEQKLLAKAFQTEILNDPTPTQADANTQWEHFKGHIQSALKTATRGHPKTAKKSCWLRDHTWRLILERKDLKSRGLRTLEEQSKYRELCRTIQYECRRDKNFFIESICMDLEKHSLNAHTADLFKKVRILSKKFKPKTWVIDDENGQPLHNLDDIAERWRSYCGRLYKGDTDTSPLPTPSGLISDHEPAILRSEITAALRSLKTRKAPGSDHITTEILVALGEQGTDLLHSICNNIWNTGIWPQDWTESIILPLHKKGSTKLCDNYRTLALISHASKVLLHVINARIRHFLDWQIPQEQAGFVKGKGTREQLLNLRQIVEKSYEFDTPVVICFVDYSKAFDCVRWDCLWGILGEMGVPQHLTALLRSLYNNSNGVVRVDQNHSKSFSFGKGVRQGCILSPILFNIYGEYILRRALEGWDGGISIGGVKLSNLRYADDTTLLAADESEMLALLSRIEVASQDLGLGINKAKTKVMVIDRTGKLELTGSLKLEVVEDFVYLGSNISNTGSCEKEIRRRIGMAKSAMSDLDGIWKDRNISKRTKIKLVQTLVFPIFLYGVEAWTMKAADRRRIDAFEMWCWRRLLRIPWTAHRTNTSILKELAICERLSSLCLRRILGYFGHIARRADDSLERLMVTGKIEGRRPRGRCPLRWTDQVGSFLGCTIHAALHAARNRHKWRTAIHKTLASEGHDPQN